MSSFDDATDLLDQLDLQCFGESLTLKTLTGSVKSFTGIFEENELIVDGLETMGYIVSVPLANWQGAYPKRGRSSVTRIKTGEEYKVYKSSVSGTDLFIFLTG